MVVSYKYFIVFIIKYFTMENAPVSIAEINNESEDKAVDLILPRSGITKKLRNLTDIPVFMFFFAYSFSETIYTNLIIYRTCMVTLGYNETVCSSLVQSSDHNATRDLEQDVQEYASKIIMGKALVTGIFPAIISLFLGPWSDSNGRKPLIYITLSGYFIYFILSCGFSTLETLDPWWLLLPAIPFSLMGGLSSIITGCFCYINDVTVAKDRSFRMGVLEAVLLLGILFGSLTSPYAFKALGYACMFAICALAAFLATLYTFYLEESLPAHEMNKCSIFNINLATGMFKTCFKQRTHYRRAILWMVMLSSALAIFSQEGDLTVTYLFTREKLNWVLADYAWYGAFGIFNSVVGIVVASFFFQKFLHINDSVVSMMAFISSLLRSILTALSSNSWNMYVASGVASLRGAYGPTNRAMLTKVVPQEDVGKVLSLTTSLETIIPLVAGPLYSIVYQNTLETFPGAYNFISAGIFLICFVLVVFVDIIIRRNPSTEYDLLVSE